MNRLATIDGTIKTPPSVAATKYSRYPTYVSTGSVWLGELPGHWKMRRLKFSLGRNDGGVWGDDFDSEGTVVLRSTEQTVGGGWNIVEPARRSLSATERAAGLLATDDLLITKSSGSELHIGKTSIVTEEVASLQCCFSNFMQRLRCSHGLLPKLVFYVLNSPIGREQFVYGSNTTTGLANLNGHVIGNLVLAVPPLDEQRAIAAFLDRETARIDALIAKKQRLIELLQEKRTALISHTVTKGLNLDVSMKNSGIEWFGEIPEHWEITRLGWVSDEISDINHEMPASAFDGVAFLSAKDLLDNGTLNFTDSIKRISEDDYERLARKSRPRRGDIIYSRIGACLGKARLVEVDEKFLVSYSCCVIRLSPSRANRRFFRHLLDAEMVLIEAKMRTQGIGVPDLGLREICRFPVPLPPLCEQSDIADYLDKADAAVRLLSKRIDDGIEQLREYRSALISAAVTGKIDVRREVS